VASCLAEAIATNCFSALSFLVAAPAMVRNLTACVLRDTEAHAAARRTAVPVRRRLVERTHTSRPVRRTNRAE
jgi:hypothetical protein